MSIFARPESPPPRAPSPDHCISLNPLPIRSKRSQASMRPMSAAAFNNDVPKQKPILRSVHSLDTAHTSDLTYSTDDSVLLGHALSGSGRTSKGILKVSPPPSPSFASVSSYSSTGSGKAISHSRSLQFAVPYRSPPASPTLAGLPPPVPPIPTFVLTNAEEKEKERKEKEKMEREREREKEAAKEKPRKRRHSRAGGEAKSLTSRIFSLCTSRRNVAVC
ncbi:hypothetical protein DFH05DRAFT_1513610 [Lentinula detonsa]|uniref:Uncharacterized protein n=1 Tax=Lentinula detonsa TaxID=2804962 RepID=A0A9W8NRN2_9AGAR|nr:hypothetical protein DFH05DRAFT_1513610 [Lentinula detonsa]